jgi:hypothetical protein
MLAKTATLTHSYEIIEDLSLASEHERNTEAK